MMRQLFLLICLIISIKGQSLRNISAQDLISFPSIRNLQMHANSQLIIFEQRTTDLKVNTYRHHLWQMDLNGNNISQFTYSSGDEWDPRISPGGAHVAFYSDRPDDMGEVETRVWMMSVSGGEAKPLTPPGKDILDFKWNAKGTAIFYLTPAKETKQSAKWLMQREKSGFDAIDHNPEKPSMELWTTQIVTSKSKRIFVGDPGIMEFDVDLSDELLVYSTNYTGDENDWVQTDLFLFSLRDSVKLRQLTNFKGTEDNPTFSPSGKSIAFQRTQDHHKPFSQIELELVPTVGGESTRLTHDLDLSFSQYQWYDENSLILEINQGLGKQIYRTNLQGSSSPITGGSAYFFHSALTLGSPAIATVKQTANGLGEIFLSTGPGHPWKKLTNQSTALEKLNIHPQTSYKWISRDERFMLQGLVVVPTSSSHAPLPLIVDIHGGPAGQTDIALEQFSLYQAWASQGFAVFSPNYRGSEGYNAEFQVANYRDLGGGDYHDIMAGVNDLIKRGVAHPDSLVIMGGSYGGYMTNWTITQTNRFKAAVSSYGIFDLRGDFSTSIYAQWELDYLGKPYWDDPAAYRRMSPSNYIKKAHTPTLILHGSDDENTFTSNSRELFRALKTLDIPHRFFLYPREGHGMSEPNHRLDVFEKKLSWVNLHLNRQQALQGADWLSQELRVQLLSSNPKATFINRKGEKFLRVKLLIDGSRLTRSKTFQADDFTIGPGNLQVIGVPSGQILARGTDFSLTIGPDTPTLELELVFPYEDHPHQTLQVRGLGEYALSF